MPKQDKEGNWIPSKRRRVEKGINGEWIPSRVSLETDIVGPWLDLYFQFKGVRSTSTEDYRAFKAWVGVSPDVAEMIFCKYFASRSDKARFCLALTLNFLKCMPTQDEGAANFKISRPTYRKYLWRTIDFLNQSMNEVFLTDISCYSHLFRYHTKKDLMGHSLNMAYSRIFMLLLMQLNAQLILQRTKQPSLTSVPLGRKTINIPIITSNTPLVFRSGLGRLFLF